MTDTRQRVLAASVALLALGAWFLLTHGGWSGLTETGSGAAATFYLVTPQESAVTVARWSINPARGLRQEATRLIARLPDEAIHEVWGSEVSPAGRWIALLLEDRQFRHTVWVVDARTLELVYRSGEPRKDRFGSWLKWLGPDELVFSRDVASPDTADLESGKNSELWSVRGPGWSGLPVRLARAREDGLQRERRHADREWARKVEAAAKRLGAARLVPPGEGGDGGEPAWIWPPYFGPPAAAQAVVRGDGGLVAAVSGPPPSSRLVVMRGANRWELEWLRTPPRTRWLRLWGRWLVVGVGRLVKDPDYGPNRHEGMFVDRKLWFYDLTRMRAPKEIEGDFFVAASSSRGDRLVTRTEGR